MIRAFAFLAAASLAAPAGAVDPAGGREAVAAELAELAPRIERLKREAAAGRPASELEALLARAQRLADLLAAPRPAAPAAPPAPDARELRERADALRDRGDRVAAELADLEGRLAMERRRAALAERLETAGAASDLFAETASRPAPARGATAVTGGPFVPGPDAGSPGGTLSLAPSAVEPPATRSAGSPDQSLRTLERRRTEMQAALAALKAQADALDAEASAADRAR